MTKQIQLVGHLDAAELFERYRAAADRVARSQLQIIWLLTSGKSLAEVAAASGYATRWIQKLIPCLSGYHPHPQHLGCAHRGRPYMTMPSEEYPVSYSTLAHIAIDGKGPPYARIGKKAAYGASSRLADAHRRFARATGTAASQGFRTAHGLKTERRACDAPHRRATRSWPKTLESRLHGSISRTFGISRLTLQRRPE